MIIIIVYEFESLIKENTVPSEPTVNMKLLLQGVQDFPNLIIRKRLIKLFSDGAEIPFCCRYPKLTCKHHIPRSAKEDPDEVFKFINQQLREKRIFWDKNNLVECAYLAPLTVQRKNGKVRVCPNCSYPEKCGTSLNSMILKEDATLDLANLYFLLNFNKNANFGGKIDFKSQFRQIRVNHSYWKYQQYKIGNIRLVDMYVVWGMRHSSKHGNDFTLAIQHIASKQLPRSLRFENKTFEGNFNDKSIYDDRYNFDMDLDFHGSKIAENIKIEQFSKHMMPYIDDTLFWSYTFMGCLILMLNFMVICAKLNIIIGTNKTVLPTQNLDELGIQFDFRERMVSMRPKTISKICIKLLILKYTKSQTVRFHQSLAGSMNFAVNLTWPLKGFMHPYYKAIKAMQDNSAIVINTISIREYSKFLLKSLKYMNGIYIKNVLYHPIVTKKIRTDASNKAYGGFSGTHWFYDTFNKEELILIEKSSNNRFAKKNNTCFREGFCTTAAFSAFGPLYSGHVIVITVDNKGLYYALVKKYIKDENISHLLSQIYLLALKYRFRFVVSHEKREFNEMADALSKLEIDKFKRLAERDNITIDPAPTLFQRPEGKFNDWILE